ncbi:hypothetical protein GCM10008957_42900 [Deinococcus ruber]|uniref:Uncharacterized protein n=1 Tax=Deinococcus ruber TaxID=1848197 RepID=A0A918CL80_9DEIO|nr:hypothetical protein GCM10008957_42900 [Deinococcus ruber]
MRPSRYDVFMVQAPPVIKDFVHRPEMVEQLESLELYHDRAWGSVGVGEVGV